MSAEDLDKVLALAKPYFRFEHGRQQRVSGYAGRSFTGEMTREELADHMASVHGFTGQDDVHAAPMEQLQFMHDLQHNSHPGMDHAHVSVSKLDRTEAKWRGGNPKLSPQMRAMEDWVAARSQRPLHERLKEAVLSGDPEGIALALHLPGGIGPHLHAEHGGIPSHPDLHAAHEEMHASGVAGHTHETMQEGLARIHQQNEGLSLEQIRAKRIEAGQALSKRMDAGIAQIRQDRENLSRLTDSIALTPRTPEASTVPEPHGKPNGPGLFHHKGLQAPPYIQHVAGELMKKGKSESEAYHMAVGIVENWKNGHDGHHHRVHADVQAAAAKNIAQWEKDRAVAHADHGAKKAAHDSDKVNATACNAYEESLLALAAPAGWPSGKPYSSSMLPPGPTTSVGTLQFDPRRPGRVLNAPGTRPLTGGNPVGGSGYGQLFQAPSQTVAAGPNLPPGVKPPSADEINKVSAQLTPYVEDSDVLRGAQKFLTNAANDASNDNYVECLRMVRAAAAAVTAARRKRVLDAAPIVMSYQGNRTGGLAGPNPGTPPAAQSSNANATVSQAYKGINDLKALVQTLAEFIDRIRRYHFHGMYGGLGGPSVRFSNEIALSEVEGYVREEHGKLEHVEPYSTSHLDKVVGQAGTKAPTTAFQPEHQGYFTDALGEKHWGYWGAAGLLIHHDDENGVRRYLLQKRAGGVQHGNTWSTPGGGMDEGETPVESAFREATEEFGKMPDNLTVTDIHTRNYGTPGQPGHWAYHTVGASTPEQFTPKGSGSTAWESAGFKWVTPAEMADLPGGLHPGFKATAQRLGAPVEPEPEKPQTPPFSDRSYQVGDPVMARLGEDPIPGTIASEPDANGKYQVNVKDGQVLRFAADMNHVYKPGETVWTRNNKQKIVKATVLPTSKGNNYDLALEGAPEGAKPSYRRGNEIRKLHELTEEKAQELNSKPPPPKYTGGTGNYNPPTGKFKVGDTVTAYMAGHNPHEGTVTQVGKQMYHVSHPAEGNNKAWKQTYYESELHEPGWKKPAGAPSGKSSGPGYQPSGEYSAKATWGEKTGYAKFKPGDRVTIKMPWSDTVKTGTVDSKSDGSQTIAVRVDGVQKITYFPEDLRLDSEGTEAKKPGGSAVAKVQAAVAKPLTEPSHKVGDRVVFESGDVEGPDQEIHGTVDEADPAKAMISVLGDDGDHYLGKPSEFRRVPNFKKNQPVSWKMASGKEQFGSIETASRLKDGSISYMVRHQQGALVPVHERFLTSVAPPPTGLPLTAASIH